MNPLLITAIGLAVLVFLGFIGYHFLYRKWMPDHLARQGYALVEEGEYKTAALKARRALQMNPKSVDAHRVMAKINTLLGIPHAVVWWQRVVDLAPRSVEDRLQLIQTSLAFDELRVARYALEGFDGEEKQRASYYSAAGAIAKTDGNRESAIENYAKAVELEPENRNYAFDLAAAQLGSEDFSIRRKGVQTLESLAELPEFRIRAGRLIIEDLSSRELFAAAAHKASSLAKDPDAEFSDRLRYVELLRRAGDFAYFRELISLQQGAAENADEAGRLLISLVRAGSYNEALSWGNSLTEEVRQDPAVNAPLALAHALAGEIEAAEKLAKASQWGKFEYLRHAILAKALWDRENTPAFRAQWNLAVANATGEPDALVQLSEIAFRMGWNSERRELLWPIARGNDRAAANWALKSLYKEYSEAGNTQALLNVFERMLELSPADPALLNNRAMLLLLLNQKVDQALETARGLHEKTPGDPNYASTYAFALYRAGRKEEALEVMKALPIKDLQDPAIAGYYGLLLSASGHLAEAAPLFENAKKAPLLPEEKALFEKAEVSN